MQMTHLRYYMRIKRLINWRWLDGSNSIVAPPGEQTNDAQGIGGDFIPTHRAITLLDPPPNGTLTRIVGAIEPFGGLMTLIPFAIPRQAVPQGRAIQKQEPEAIGQAGLLS